MAGLRIDWSIYGDIKNETGFREETLDFIYFKVC